jgi:NhaA family Na+:H+ antiporter
VAPWSAFVILPIFAFSASGIGIAMDFSTEGARRVFAGVVLGLVIGKPVGVLLASWIAIATRFAIAPEGVAGRHFVGAACLCGVADTVALLLADRAFASPGDAAVAKVAVLVGSAVSGVLGALILRRRVAARTPTPDR